jgi:hypothetical protein
MEHLDLADPENVVRFEEVVSMVEEQSLQYPLVAVDGRLRLSGSAEYYYVLPLVQEALAGD